MVVGRHHGCAVIAHGPQGARASQLIAGVLLLRCGERTGSRPGRGHGAQVRDRAHRLRRPNVQTAVASHVGRNRCGAGVASCRLGPAADLD
jgi:hypothetical protein